MSHAQDPAAASDGAAVGAAEDRVAYDADFSRKVHRIGRITLLVALAATFSIPLYLTLVKGYGIDTGLLTAGVVFALSFVGIVWIIEPVSYYPVLGPIGTYMSFLSGNAANMRVPVVGAVQSAVNAEPGTKKAEVAAVFGLMASTITNLVVLIGVVLGGTWLVSVLPASVTGAFVYAIPAIVGCMIVTFGTKLTPVQALATVVLAVVVVGAITLITALVPAVGKILTVAQVGIAALCAIALAVIWGRRSASRSDG